MRYRVLAVVIAAGLLGGCSNADWDNALSYVGVGGSEKAPAAPAPQQAAPAQTVAAPQAAPAADEWCTEVAKAAATAAAEEGFDLPTQQRRAQTAYQQCVH